MKANFSDTNDFVQSMNRGKRKKKIALLVLCIVLAFLVAACVVVGLKIRESLEEQDWILMYGVSDCSIFLRVPKRST